MEIGEQFRAIKSADFSAYKTCHSFFSVTRCDNNEEQLKIVSKKQMRLTRQASAVKTEIIFRRLPLYLKFIFTLAWSSEKLNESVLKMHHAWYSSMFSSHNMILIGTFKLSINSSSEMIGQLFRVAMNSKSSTVITFLIICDHREA